MRIASLGSVWVLVFFGSLAGPFLPLISLFRMAFGMGQLALNHTLSRRSPLANRDWLDWACLVLAVAGSIVAAVLARMAGEPAPLFVLPVLLPYSVIQVRSFRRSLEAHARPRVEPLRLPVRERETERAAA